MPIAILDPFSGIAGDMMLGALVDADLDADWLRALPARLGLDGVGVDIRTVHRAGIACIKVDFAIPPQPHGRGLEEIRRIIAAAAMPAAAAAHAEQVFAALATVEGKIHGLPPERVHLHEVGAVDAILDVVGAVWGLAELGVTCVYCGPIALGDGVVQAAHGTLPVPAPATLRLLEGLTVRPGPDDAGELVTPTGAALVRVLSAGPPPAAYIPLRSGFGAGSKDPPGRPNALRMVLADAAMVGDAAAGSAPAGVTEQLVQLSADIDDMSGEWLAGAADVLRSAGALDVVLLPNVMKKGRPGTRVDVLVRPAAASAVESLLLSQTTSIGVRRITVERRALHREMHTVQVLGYDVRVKVVTLPSGGTRTKPEFDDVQRIAGATGRPIPDVALLAREAGERLLSAGVL